MQPPAEVEPARISQVEQPLSRSAMSRMSAARAVSREENDIFRIESMIGLASNSVMSTCSTVFPSSSALVFLRALATTFTGAALAPDGLAEVLEAMGRGPCEKGRQRATASPIGKSDLAEGYSSALPKHHSVERVLKQRAGRGSFGPRISV